MNIELLSTLIQKASDTDCSDENHAKAIKLCMFILKTHQQVRAQGLGVLEDFKSEYPLFDRGLKLVRMGMDPVLVEKALVTALLTNRVELFPGLIIIEGVQAIQTGQSSAVIEELLKAYFPFELEEIFEQEMQKNGLRTNCDRTLSREEISRLLQVSFRQ